MGGHKNELTNIKRYALLQGRIGRELAPSSMKNSSKCITNDNSPCRDLIQQIQNPEEKGKKPSTRCFDEFNDPDSSDEEQQADEDAVAIAEASMTEEAPFLYKNAAVPDNNHSQSGDSHQNVNQFLSRNVVVKTEKC